MCKDGHGETAIQELLAKSRCNRQRQIGEQLHGGLRQDPFGDGLKRASRFYGNSPHAPQVQPLKGGNGRGADKRGNQSPGSAMDRQTKLRGRESVRPGTPCHHRDGQPLKGHGRSVKRKPFHRANAWHRQQLPHAHSPAPRQNQGEHEKDEPDVPRHQRMRTLPVWVAQVTNVPTVPTSRSVSDEPSLPEVNQGGQRSRGPRTTVCRKVARPPLATVRQNQPQGCSILEVCAPATGNCRSYPRQLLVTGLPA